MPNHTPIYTSTSCSLTFRRQQICRRHIIITCFLLKQAFLSKNKKQVHFQNAFDQNQFESCLSNYKWLPVPAMHAFVVACTNPSWHAFKKMLFSYQLADSQPNFSRLSHQTFSPYVCLPLEASQILSWREGVLSGVIHPNPAFSARKHTWGLPFSLSSRNSLSRTFPWMEAPPQLRSGWMPRAQPATASTALCLV